MSYAEQKAKRQAEDANVGRHDFSWEEKELPTLHSGFMEPCVNKPEHSTLFLSLWFNNGSYRFRLQDRSSDEKCFGDAGTLREAFQAIERMLVSGDLDWTPDSGRRRGYNGT